MGVRLVSNYAEELRAKADLGVLSDAERPLLARAEELKATAERRLKSQSESRQQAIGMMAKKES